MEFLRKGLVLRSTFFQLKRQIKEKVKHQPDGGKRKRKSSLKNLKY